MPFLWSGIFFVCEKKQKRKSMKTSFSSERGDFLVISLPLSKQLIINLLFFISNSRLLVNNTRFRTRVWTKKIICSSVLGLTVPFQKGFLSVT